MTHLWPFHCTRCTCGQATVIVRWVEYKFLIKVEVGKAPYIEEHFSPPLTEGNHKISRVLEVAA